MACRFGFVHHLKHSGKGNRITSRRWKHTG
jgi:hypothetical protein